MKKKISIVVTILLGLVIWYLFIKKYDYQITFKTNAAPGGVFYQLQNLKFNSKKEGLILKTNPFTSIQQEVEINNNPVILDWRFTSIGDTVSRIKVGILSKNQSIKNRMQVLVGSSKLVDSVKSDLITFRKRLLQYTNKFRVIVEGEMEIPEMQVISVSSSAKRSRKANVMISSNAYLHPMLKENNISKNGFPFVKIKDWNIKTDSIHFDFGFPVKHPDSLPADSDIVYGKIKKKKALKAIYYGNYSNSDEAWFVLLEYAKKNNIILENKPLEIFHNNPMQGGNELDWKAEIFLPIKSD